MKKVLFITVAMVLLSGAALAQPNDALIIGGIYGIKDLTMQWHIANMHTEWVKSGNTFFMWYEPRKIKSGVTINAPDPTAWKQTDSKFGEFAEANRSGKCDEACGNRCTFEGFISGACFSACLGRCVNTNPWGDSRYRLEKNEVTGKCRVTEFRDNTWKPAHGRDLFGYSCEQASEHLEEYRQSEREDRAWKPIK